jgi:2-polyprenyl-6-methoxyphenol hydroxylase-like FAD-dependent oxidoreductase
MARDEETIVVVGAGIAGLGAALALSRPGRRVTLLDQDPPPPDGDADSVFRDWNHRGVAQLRHSHAFLARLHNLLRARYPQLLDALRAAGAREITFRDGLPETLRASYVPAPEDDDLTILTSRRTTLEIVIRRWVQAHCAVTIETGVKVEGIVAVPGTNPVQVTGVELVRTGPEGERRETLSADVVIDASGRRSTFPRWLKALGAEIEEESSDAGILYYTRHYRLRAGQAEPARGKVPGAGDLGYLKYGVFPADNGCFSITLAVPTPEADFRKLMTRADVFQQVCVSLPGLVPWVDPERAEPTTDVFGMGGLRNRYLHFVKNGVPAALGFFAVGDAFLFSNPLYGRGCSQGFLHSHLLADVLDRTADPRERAVAYEAVTAKELRPFFDAGVQQDRSAIRRAEFAMMEAPPKRGLKARLAKSFAEDAVIPASRGDLAVLRALSRGFHMLEPPALAFRRPAVLLPILRYWLMAKPRKAGFYPPRLGPERKELRRLLGLAA